MSQYDITVVIVSYNVRSFLDHCLQSVRRASAGLKVQVIVVDNASSDESARMVAQRYPDVTLIANQENVGFGRANNQAFNQAQGEFVLVLNPDSFVQEDTLVLLRQRLQELPQVGAIGPRIILPDGHFEPRSMRGFPTPWAAFSYLSGFSAIFPRSPKFSRYLLTYLDPEKENQVGALSGCCMLVRRSLLVKLHGFDPDYFMYGEDLDLCYRISRQGYQILYTPITRIVHFKGESTRRSAIDHGYHFQRAMQLFVEKNLVGNLSFLSRWIISLGFWFRALERRLLAVLNAIAFPAMDIILLNVLIYFGRLTRWGEPGYTTAVWLVNGLYSLFYLSAGFLFRAFSAKRLSGRMALYSALAAGILSSAATYFTRQWAFSRFVVLWFVLGMILLMPGWRMLLRQALRGKSGGRRRSWLRRRTLIVGTDSLARQISSRLSHDPASDFEPVGYISFSENSVGEILEGLPVLGSAEELDRMISAERIQEVLFSTGEASYERIIGLIQNLSQYALNFRIIPRESRPGEDDLPLLRLELSSVHRRKKPA